MKKLLTTAAVAAFGFGIANAAIVDFEAAGPEGTVVTPGDFNDAGISFTSSDTLQIVQVGPPQTGFRPDDLVEPDGAFGDFFLGTDFDDNTTDLTITYLTAVDALSFDLADIDDDEVFTITVFGTDGQELATQTIVSGDPGTGNQQVIRVGFSDLGAQIAQVVITGERSSGRLGIAFDNFNTTINTAAVPLPAAAPLFAAGLGGLAFYRRRRATR